MEPLGRRLSLRRLGFDYTVWFEYWFQQMDMSWQVLAGLTKPLTAVYQELMDEVRMSPDDYAVGKGTRYKYLFGDYFMGSVPHEYSLATEMGYGNWNALPECIKGAYVAKKTLTGYQEILRADDRWHREQELKARKG